jgi:uroporphyrinogen-III decarboxylase
MFDDPGYVHDLMTFTTDNLIRRMKAIRAWRWSRQPDARDSGSFRHKGWGLADDAIALLSPDQYREFVFPYHHRMAETFADGPLWTHLCGDATRHFPFLKEHLNVTSFDTGFPVDFGQLRRDLGPDVQISGGPTVMLLKDGTPAAIRREVERICKSGIMKGGRFILRDANNLAPCTPVENIAAFYEAGKTFGRYDREK